MVPPLKSECFYRCSLQACYSPQTQLREAAISLKRSALLFVDIQNFSCHRDGACHQGVPDVSGDFAF